MILTRIKYKEFKMQKSNVHETNTQESGSGGIRGALHIQKGFREKGSIIILKLITLVYSTEVISVAEEKVKTWEVKKQNM